MKRLIVLCLITILATMSLPISAAENLTKEEALTLIDQAFSMYLDNYWENTTQEHSDEYWEALIPSIFTEEFGSWVYDSYIIGRPNFGGYTLSDDYEDNFTFLSNSNAEANVAIDIKFKIYEEWDYPLVVNFINTTNGWRINGVDHKKIFFDVPNVDKDKIDDATLEALIYNSFHFYRFLFERSHFFVYGCKVAEPVKIEGLMNQGYVSDLFVCTKYGLDDYSSWIDVSKSIFQEDIANKALSHKKYLKEIDGKVYFVHSGYPMGERFRLPENILDECILEYNDNGKAIVIFNIIYAPYSDPYNPVDYPVTIELECINNKWVVSGGSYTEEFFNILANPNTSDTGLLTSLVFFVILLLIIPVKVFDRFKYLSNTETKV